MSSHDTLLPLPELHQVHPGNGNEPYSQGMPESQKRPYVHDGVVDNKRARMGYSPAHLVDEDGKRRGLMQDVKSEAKPPQSQTPSSGPSSGVKPEYHEIPNANSPAAMKRKDLLFKDITKLPVLNAPSLWYGNERVKTRGVFHQPSGRFKASLRVNGKDIYLGQYACEELACQAYDRFAIKVHGVDGDHRLNFGIVWYKDDIPLIEKTSLEQLVQEIREDAKILNKRAITLRKTQKSNRSMQQHPENINTLLHRTFLNEHMQLIGRQDKIGQQHYGFNSARDDVSGVPGMPIVSGVPVLQYPMNQSVIPQDQIPHNAYNMLANAILNPSQISQGISPMYSHQMQPSSISRLPASNNSNNILLPSVYGGHQQMGQHMLNHQPSNNPNPAGDPRYR